MATLRVTFYIYPTVSNGAHRTLTVAFHDFPKNRSPLQTVSTAGILLHGLTENDGHEIDGQDRLKIDYITMQCAIIFKTTTEYKSQQRGKLYRPPVIVE